MTERAKEVLGRLPLFSRLSESALDAQPATIQFALRPARTSVGAERSTHDPTAELLLLAFGDAAEVIGAGTLVAAGAVVPEGADIPPGSLIAGVPASNL